MPKSAPALPALRDRFAGLVVAPLLFNLSLFLLLTPLSLMRRGFSPLLLMPMPLVTTVVAVPMVLGFALGLERVIDVLGHAFLLDSGPVP